MKITVAAFSILLLAGSVLAGDPNWTKAFSLGGTVNVEGDAKKPVWRFEKAQLGANGKPVSGWVVSAPMKIWSGNMDADGVVFECRGDGSKSFASILLGEKPNLLKAGWEFIFPLSSQDWSPVSIRFDEFTRCDQPWEMGAPMKEGERLVPQIIGNIGFGYSYQHTKFYPKDTKFEIRNLKFVKLPPRSPEPPPSKGLERVSELLRKGQPVNVLLLGDSITDFGRDKSYAWYAGQALEGQFKSQFSIVNAGVAGHSVRGGMIFLPRTLSMLSTPPDLVCVMYGANDCKAWNEKGDFTEAVFQEQLEAFIDRIRRSTGGKADVLLLSEVPRLNKERNASTGEVERVIGAVEKAAKSRQAAFLDSFGSTLNSTPAEWAQCYSDTIHQSDLGQQRLGDLMAKKIVAEMDAGASKCK